jgi:hypothetical protein
VAEWQTRWTQNPVPVKGVRVQLPPPVLFDYKVLADYSAKTLLSFLAVLLYRYRSAAFAVVIGPFHTDSTVALHPSPIGVSGEIIHCVPCKINVERVSLVD